MRATALLISVLLLLISFSAKAANLTLSTNAFANAGTLPVIYTCDGKDISPELNWTDIPPHTQSFALILSDQDAPDFYHWVVYNIPKNITQLTQGISSLPEKTVTGKNSWQKEKYNGPCPPKETIHTYFFTLYALDTYLSLPAGSDAKTVIKAMDKHIIQKAQLTVVYTSIPKKNNF